VGEKLEFQFLNHFSGLCCHMRLNVVMMQNNSIYQNSCAFAANSVLILYMILVLLEDGPMKVPKQCQHHIVGRSYTYELLGPGQQWVFPLHALTC
jgi:hypothetical protein